MSHRTLAFTADYLLQTLRSFPVVNAYIVGFSGGADSTALLHALKAVEKQLDVPISAVHVNHDLHGDAGLWQQQCEQFCHQLQIKLVCLKIDPDRNSGKGLEAESRHLRYQAMSALLKPGACLLTAHHANDQAETLLLNLMRGSGVDGLSAMPESRRLGNGFLQRQLLGFQSTALRDYLRENRVEWTEDPSNQYLDHDRNFVRHEVIPLLEQRWPQVGKRLLLTRQAMKGARCLLERLADSYLQQHLTHPLVLRMTPALLDDRELLKLVIRRWTMLADGIPIPAHRLETFCGQVCRATEGHKVSLAWGDRFLRLYRQQLWLQTEMESAPSGVVNWPQQSDHIDLGKDMGQLVLGNDAGTAGQTENRTDKQHAILPSGEFDVGTRTSMKETVLCQGTLHKSLKNLYQANGVPPWLRDYIPLCRLNGELVAMGDWCFGGQFKAWMSAHNSSLSWRPGNPLLQFIHSLQHPEKH